MQIEIFIVNIWYLKLVLRQQWNYYTYEIRCCVGFAEFCVFATIVHNLRFALVSEKIHSYVCISHSYFALGPFHWLFAISMYRHINAIDNIYNLYQFYKLFRFQYYFRRIFYAIKNCTVNLKSIFTITIKCLHIKASSFPKLLIY